MQPSHKTILNIISNSSRWRSIIFSIFLLVSPTIYGKSIFSRYEKVNAFQVLAGGYFQTNIRVNNLEPYFDKDPVRAFFPYARIKVGKFSITPDYARFVIFNHPLTKLDLRLSYKGHPYNAEGMAIRHKTIYAGIGLRILMIKLEALKDISGISNAGIYSIAGVIPIPLGKYGIITLQAEVEYWDGKYVDYYFGVRENEVTPTRPYYKGNWAKDYNFKIMGQFFLSKHWIIRATPAFRYYDQTIYNSPTVSKQREYSLLLGLGYQL